MNKERILAFSDGVLAIIITIMVLELKIPHGDKLEDLKPLIPIVVSYILSFVHIGIYWNNHHHMMYAVKKVNGVILWANLHLLFWLSLLPFVTGWMGENYFTTIPVALYGLDLFMSSIAYFILSQCLLKYEGKSSVLAAAVGNDFKGKISSILYVLAIVLAFINAWTSLGIYTLVAMIWVIPDKRIEKVISE
jgi:TMEM175 potassium channel family protein